MIGGPGLDRKFLVFVKDRSNGLEVGLVVRVTVCLLASHDGILLGSVSELSRARHTIGGALAGRGRNPGFLPERRE
jgi:hypothetical protein